MTEFIDDASAYFFGYVDAVNYEAYNSNLYDLSDEGIESYRNGYAKGMDVCRTNDGGVAPLENRSEDYQEIYSYYI